MEQKIMKSLLVLLVGSLFLLPIITTANTRSIPSEDNFDVYHWSDEQRQSWENQHPLEEELMSNGESPHTLTPVSTSGLLNSSWPM